MIDWTELRKQFSRVSPFSIRDLFADPHRAQDFSVTLASPVNGTILFDYSKTRMDAGVRGALIALADAAGVEARREAMFSGEAINETEGRAVLHTALRNLDASVTVGGKDVMPEVRATLTRMESFARDLRDGRIRGVGGRITDVVNIGIGGSDLGPAMAVQALAPYCDGPRCHFVSNVDGAHVHDVLDALNPETTLVIVASKTFTTIETMTNAQTAKAWMARSVAEPTRQFVALSTAMDKTAAFGIDPARVFGFADWVGGRYSMWGPIGLSLMIAIGPEDFRAFLAGAAEMDTHFRSAPLGQNMPVMLAMVGVWHRQVCGYAARAVLPYDQRLARLPAYLQQLEMESNGKAVAMDGSDLAVPSGPVVFGEPGTNGQHAFFQQIHQGPMVVPAEFIVVRRTHETPTEAPLWANALAQAQALMIGKSEAEAHAELLAGGASAAEADRLAAHKTFPGDRPSTTILLPALTPEALGALLALYEHKTFVEGVIWDINSFDQWGVELGKVLAKAILKDVDEGAPSGTLDPSTADLLTRLL